MSNVNGREESGSRGNFAFVTINLPKLALESKSNVEEFFKLYDKYITLCHDYLLCRLKVIEEKHVYNFVVSQADKVSYMQETYSVGCMYARNRKLVDGSDLCVAYLSTDKGGTAYTCNYAKQKGVRVINLYDHLNETDKQIILNKE